MRMYDIILKKRDGEELTKHEIDFFIRGYVDGSIPDYQAAALLMAIYLKGMTKQETASLTLAMAYSGEVVDLSAIHGVKVDKHSTGGVGDTTTLVIAPLVAACGVPVVKMSGRGLGHTGGTIDKLESIPGFRVNLSLDEFSDVVNKAGLSIMGQTGNLVPADKKLYALRDVTATVDNISLIASSIMSKKIAAGADAIVLDVKTGKGAFMQELEGSFELAREMVAIGNMVGRKTSAIVTDMDQPLGMAIGNSLEVIEAIEVLNGQSKGPLKEVCIVLASHMLYAAGRTKTVEEGIPLLEEVLSNGSGLQKLKEMIKLQHGNEAVVEDLTIMPRANHIIPVICDQDGFIQNVDARQLGECALVLGAGRNVKEEEIDPAVGIVMKVRVGDSVKKGEVISELHINDITKLEQAKSSIMQAVKIGNEKPKQRQLIYGVVTE